MGRLHKARTSQKTCQKNLIQGFREVRLRVLVDSILLLLKPMNKASKMKEIND
jgi:hypothetical protein